MNNRPTIAFLRIAENTLVSHRIYDADFFDQLSGSFDMVRIDHPQKAASVRAWFDDLSARSVDYVFVFVFAVEYLDSSALLRIRNELGAPVGFIIVPCILVPGLAATYRELPALLREHDVVFIFSDFVRRQLGQISERYDDFATPCFIDYETFRENTKRSTVKLDILHCARLIPDKGLAELLRALNALDARCAFRLHIITDVRPPHAPRGYVREVNGLIEEFGLRPHIVFYGSLCDEQQRRKNIMSRCDALVHLTTYPGETFGRIVVEAFAAGLAVITTNWQGVNESVTPQNGYLIEVHDRDVVPRIEIDEVTRALEALYCPETLARFKRANREKAKQYDFRPHVARLRESISARLAAAYPQRA